MFKNVRVLREAQMTVVIEMNGPIHRHRVGRKDADEDVGEHIVQPPRRPQLVVRRGMEEKRDVREGRTDYQSGCASNRNLNAEALVSDRQQHDREPDQDAVARQHLEPDSPESRCQVPSEVVVSDSSRVDETAPLPTVKPVRQIVNLARRADRGDRTCLFPWVSPSRRIPPAE